MHYAFSQDENGDTTINGIFKNGLINPPYQFDITDMCGNVIRNITKILNVNNGTKPFNAKIKNLNLNCDKNRILFANCSGPYHLKKRDVDSQMSITDGEFPSDNDQAN
ncbi:13348_t:CDS:2 [Dentiscutata erythropus]|uniref:13348_t:CDS:1 n=1 Tax=Dentiscutata erythropus TaxID=1348616 RepID=A0A9N9HZM0_9GLOM|nr:13348_t:CDS:2 [Dentiscutata erythropus]